MPQLRLLGHLLHNMLGLHLTRHLGLVLLIDAIPGDAIRVLRVILLQVGLIRRGLGASEAASAVAQEREQSQGEEGDAGQDADYDAIKLFEVE